MPMFGGAAKNRARCEGRVFTGEFDDCFNDYLPILELVAPLVGLAFLYMFARFAFVIWAPDPEHRSLSWQLASASPSAAYWPELHGVAAVGLAWAGWRASTYMFAVELWPFVTYWLSFAAWFAAALAVSWPRNASAR